MIGPFKMPRIADPKTSKESILPMIGGPSTIHVVWEAGLILSPISQRFHMGWVDNGEPPMYSHHHEGAGASSKQVMMVEGQHVSRSQRLNLHSIVEPNGIDSKILNNDGNLGELHDEVENWQAMKQLTKSRC